MKRKTSQISSSDDPPSPIRSSFPRGFRGVQSSSNRWSTSSSREIQDAADTDNPKTSEYAFFKKLKEDVSVSAAASGHDKIHGRSLHHVRNRRSKLNFSSGDFSSTDRSNTVENRHKDFKSSLLPEIVTTPPVIVVSPLRNVSNKSVADMERAADISLADAHSMQEKMEEYGSQCKKADIFSRKRQKLRHLVVKSSCSRVDELCSKGYDLVSVLLAKLFPGSNEEKSFDVLKTGKLDTDTKFRSLTFPELEMGFKESHWMPTSNFMELEYGQSLDNGFSSDWSEIPRERKLPRPSSSRHCTKRTNFDNTIMELNYELGETATPMVWNEGNSTFNFHIKQHGPLTSRHVGELAEFHYPIEPLYEREPRTLLLGWDFDNTTTKSNLSIHCQNEECSLLPIPYSSHGDIELHDFDNRFSASGFSNPSLFSYQPPILPSLQFSPSGSNRSYNFGQQFLEFKDNVISVLDNFSLSFPQTGNHLDLSECSYCDTTCKCSSILFSPQNHLWFMRKLLNKEHRLSGSNTVLATGLDFCLEPNCISASCPSRDYYSQTCCTLGIPQHEGMSSQFLIGDKNENYLDRSSHREIINHL